MPPPRDLTDTALVRLKPLWEEGRGIKSIARTLGVSRVTLRRWLAQLGWVNTRARSLPIRRATYYANAAANAVRALAQINGQRWRAEAAELARRYGLPEDLHPIQVRVLVALAGGPKGVRDLASAATNRNPDRGFGAFNTPARPWRGNLLTDLAKRGLIVKVQSYRAFGQGRNPAVYLLTPTAMVLMSQGETQ